MKRIFITLLVIVATGAGAAYWVLHARHESFLTDADTIRETAASATVREVLWQPPTLLPRVNAVASDEFEPRLCCNDSTLFFVRGKPGKNADIYSCQRTPTGWSEPTPVTAINTKYDELGPEPSPDGQFLYFYSDRPGGLGGYDIWVAKRAENGSWNPPTNLGQFVNSSYNEYGPALAPDGKSLCFASNRPRASDVRPSDDAWQATVREDLYRHDYDLFVSTITDAGFQAAIALTHLNTSSNEGAPAFSPIGDFLYFSSDRPGGHGGFDIYRARIVRGQFQSPANLGAGVNTSANELDPALALGGYALDFSSDRPLSTSQDHQAGHYHLYRTMSRDVFRDVETHPVVIDWAKLWRQAGPNMMWAILALLLMVLLIALMRDLRRRQLSLLARCLLASLFIHVLLMFLFNVMRVSNSVVAVIRGNGGRRVTLAAGSKTTGLYGQIRGSLTQVSLPALASPSAPRRIGPVFQTVAAKSVELPAEHSTPVPNRAVLSAHAIDAPLRSISAGVADLSRIDSPNNPFVGQVALPRDVSRIEGAELDAAKSPARQFAKTDRVPIAFSAAPSTVAVILPPETSPSRAAESGPAVERQSVVVAAPPQDARPGEFQSAGLVPVTALATGGSNPGPALPDAWSLPSADEVAVEHADEAKLIAPSPFAATSDTRETGSTPSITDSPVMQALRPDESAGHEHGLPVLSPKMDRFADAAIRSTGSSDVIGLASITTSANTADSVGQKASAQAALYVTLPSDAEGSPISTSESREMPKAALAPAHTAPSPTLYASSNPTDAIVAVAPIGNADSSPGAIRSAITAVAPNDSRAALGLGIGSPVVLQKPAMSPGELSIAMPDDSGASPISASEPHGAVIAAPQTLEFTAASPAPFIGGNSTTTIVTVTPMPGASSSPVAIRSAVPTVAPNDSRAAPGIAIGSPIVLQGPTPPPTELAVAIPDDTDSTPTGGRTESQTKPSAVAGEIRGIVTDAVTSQPIANANVRVDMPGQTVLVAPTDEAGRYWLEVPELPEFFAVTASKDGYLAKTRNVAMRSVKGRTKRLNFALQAESQRIISVEEVPTVHHLGNDLFDGQINSQFQREAEGRSYHAAFELRSDQLPKPGGFAELTLMAKGVQCPNKIRINGEPLLSRLDHSPADGSFGSFSATIDPVILHEGTNEIEIRSVSCRGDLDDFEFINLQIRLSSGGL